MVKSLRIGQPDAAKHPERMKVHRPSTMWSRDSANPEIVCIIVGDNDNMVSSHMKV